jgi:hypothetical protein
MNIAQLGVLALGIAILLPIVVIGGPWAQAAAMLSMCFAYIAHFLAAGSNIGSVMFGFIITFMIASMVSGLAAVGIFLAL